ncbi:sensor histidine kinase [Gordonia shandongensis]|uniref:sensor histidine kinase n=1 Tax=Gordonia shandongensis TaxID=376351 RepID=UPI0004071896|nr:ATP-binding protein [Gordonia shandongensis]
MARFVGAGYCIYAVLVIPALIAQARGVVAGWVPPVAAVLAFGPGIALLGIALLGDPAAVGPAAVDPAAVGCRRRWITAAALGCAVGPPLAAAAWAAAGVGHGTEAAVWMMDFAGLAALAAVLVRPVWQAIAVLVVGKLSGAAVAVAHTTGVDAADCLREAAFGIVFTSIFVLLAAAVLRIGDELDRSRQEAGRIVSAGVDTVERARVDALIHDRVLATFVLAAADRDDPRVAEQACDAVRALDRLVDAVPTDDDPVSAVEAVARVRAVISGVSADVPVTVELSEQPGACPPGVVAALAEAAAEAVRNSVMHAGRDAQCIVLLTVDDTGMRIVVADDGVGFDPHAVSPDRLGLVLSIRRRVGRLAGGRCDVASVRGRGTTVRLGWCPDGPDAP